MVIWYKFFSYSSIQSNYIFLGFYMGNGDVGVVVFILDNSQILKILKVDFVMDGWIDWVGSGLVVLFIGGVNIIVNFLVYFGFVIVNWVDFFGFSYQMDQLNSEL